MGERVRRQESRPAFEWDGAGVRGDHVGAERGRAREDVVWREQVAGDGSRCTGDDGHDERTAMPQGDVAGSGLPVTVGVPGALTLAGGDVLVEPLVGDECAGDEHGGERHHAQEDGSADGENAAVPTAPGPRGAGVAVHRFALVRWGSGCPPDVPVVVIVCSLLVSGVVAPRRLAGE